MTNDLGRVDDAELEHVAIFFGLRVEPELGIVAFTNLARNDRAIDTGVFGDLAQRSFESLAHDRDADCLVVVLAGHVHERLAGLNQSHATANDDAFLNRSAGGVQRVVDAVLTLFHFGLGHATDADDGNAACQLGNTFLQFFTVVVRGGFLDLLTDLADAGFDLGFLTGTVHDGRCVLRDRDALGGAQHVHGHVFQLHAQIFRDDLTTGQDRDILQHRLAAIAESRSLDGRDLQTTAQLVDDQRGKGLAFDVFSDDQQRLLRLNHLLQKRNHRLQRRELLLVQQDNNVFQFGGHLVGIGHEVRRQVAAVELHAFDDIGLGLEAFVLFYGDDTLVADFLHCVGDLTTDFRFAVGRDGADLRDFVAVGHVTGGGLDGLDDLGSGQIDTALQVHRVHARCDRLHAFLDDGLGQNRRGGGAVTGFVIGAGSDFLDHLRAHVLELVLKLDLFGDRHTVLGDAGGTERLVQNHVTTLGAQRDLDSVGQDVDAFQNTIAGIGVEFHVLSSHVILLEF